MADRREVVVNLYKQKVLECNGVIAVTGEVVPEEGPFKGRRVRYATRVARIPGQTTEEVVKLAHDLGAKMVF